MITAKHLLVSLWRARDLIARLKETIEMLVLRLRPIREDLSREVEEVSEIGIMQDLLEILYLSQSIENALIEILIQLN